MKWGDGKTSQARKISASATVSCFLNRLIAKTHPLSNHPTFTLLYKFIYIYMYIIAEKPSLFDWRQLVVS